jgi:ribose transport system substrate-binding protein
VIAKAKGYGCTVVALDDALSPDKQVSNMQQLLGQNVNAIIFYPLDPRATAPVLRQAQREDVPVIAIDASFGDTKAVPLIATQVWQGRDIQAYLQANALADEKPDANVGLIGIGIPVPAIKYLTQRQKHFVEEKGMTVVDTQDNPSDDVTGGEKAGNALLQRNQTVDSVIGYNDPSALGAVIAARATGRDITVVGLNGSSDGIEGVKSGKLIATVQVDPIGIGSQTAVAAYSLITNQNTPLPPIVIRPGVLVTQDNVNDLASWSAQLAEIE